MTSRVRTSERTNECAQGGAMEINLQTVIAYNIWRLANHSRSHAREDEEAYMHTHSVIYTYIQMQIYMYIYTDTNLHVYKYINRYIQVHILQIYIKVFTSMYTYKKRSENIVRSTYIYNTGCPIYKHILISVIGTRIRLHIRTYTWRPLTRSLV